MLKSCLFTALVLALCFIRSGVGQGDASRELFFKKRIIDSKYGEFSPRQVEVFKRVLENQKQVSQLGSFGPDERAAVNAAIAGLERSEVKKCLDGKCCPRNALGCEKLKALGDWVEGLFVIDPCLLSRQKCAGGKTVGSKSAVLANVIDGGLAQRVWIQLERLGRSPPEAEKRKWLLDFISRMTKSREIIEGRLKSCQKERISRVAFLDQDAREMLIRGGAGVLTTEASRACRDALVSAIKAVTSRSTIVGQKVAPIQKWLEQTTHQRMQFGVLKCEGVCRELLCGGSNEGVEDAGVFLLETTIGPQLVIPRGEPGPRGESRDESVCEGANLVQPSWAVEKILGQKANRNTKRQPRPLQTETPASGPEIDLILPGGGP